MTQLLIWVVVVVLALAAVHFAPTSPRAKHWLNLAIGLVAVLYLLFAIILPLLNGGHVVVPD